MVNLNGGLCCKSAQDIWARFRSQFCSGLAAAFLCTVYVVYTVQLSDHSNSRSPLYEIPAFLVLCTIAS